MKTSDFYVTANSPWRRMWARMAATGAVIALAACQTNVVHERPTGTVMVRVKGGGPDNGPVVVLAIDRDSGRIARRAFAESKRVFSLPLESGNYKFYACADENRDGRCGGTETTSMMYALAGRVNAGDRIELPTFDLRPR
jgi:hypothetical protein